MKFLVFSDSHGQSKYAERAISLHKNTIDGVFFLGDGLAEFMTLKGRMPDVPFRCVIGNCDGASFLDFGFDYEDILTLDGKRILLTHGHRLNVKYGLGVTENRAIKDNIDIVLFGHTHTPLFQYMQPQGDNMTGGKWFCNPGSARSSFGILEFGDFGVSFHTVDFSDILS